MKRRLLTGAVAVIAGAFAVAGCQGGAADLTQAETPHVRVGYPKGWQRADDGQRLTVRKQEGGRTVAQLVVLERVTKATTADLAVNAVQAGKFAQQDYQRGSAKKVKVNGAKDARRLDYTYTSVDGGTRQPASGTDVVAVVDRDVYVVRVTGLKDQLKQADVDAIVKSIELKEG
ncbi:MAG TPA: hypothetical protein VGP70_23500 [Actinomadura sp.]|nr:hypothetical protein [Actinomadura sp.]